MNTVKYLILLEYDTISYTTTNYTSLTPVTNSNLANKLRSSTIEKVSSKCLSNTLWAVVLGFTVLSSLVHFLQDQLQRALAYIFIKPEKQRSLLLTNISHIKQGNMEILILLRVVSMFCNWVLLLLIT